LAECLQTIRGLEFLSVWYSEAILLEQVCRKHNIFY
jgi:hypothetical protein